MSYEITMKSLECRMPHDEVCTAAYDLINELKKENEKLNALCTEQNEELRRLQRVTANLINILQTKTEAIKEFVKEIINNILPKYLYGKEETALRIGFAISERAKEMTEGSK